MHLKKQPSTQDELLISGVQVDKIGDVVKQEKKSEIMGKENLDENVDDPPPEVPKPKQQRNYPQVQVLDWLRFQGQISSLVQVKPRVEMAATEKAYTGPRIDKVNNFSYPSISILSFNSGG